MPLVAGKAGVASALLLGLCHGVFVTITMLLVLKYYPHCFLKYLLYTGWHYTSMSYTYSIIDVCDIE